MKSIITRGLLVLLLTGWATYACKTADTPAATTTPAITALTCGSTVFSASAVAGAAYTGTAAVPYTGGNSALYSAGTASVSTGVTGLNAVLQAGTLGSSGNLTYTISGTPSGSGTATFALSFGGQTCNLALTVGTAGTSGSSSTITGVLSITTTANTTCGSLTGSAQVVCLAEALQSNADQYAVGHDAVDLFQNQRPEMVEPAGRPLSPNRH